MGGAPRSTETLGARLARVGRTLGEREAAQARALSEARSCAEKLRARVESALADFHREASAAGAPHLRVELSDVRVDEKHLRAVQFDLSRGRHHAIVTAKSRGDVTLVGPFRAGKPEGPCLTFPVDAGPELESALGDFLERFLEEAATP
jgi:hypothetical protein